MPPIELIADESMLDRVLSADREHPVLVFKHSLVCPASSHALDEFEEFVRSRSTGDEIGFALIEIQNTRSLSDALAARTGVRHESPQVLLLRAGVALWSTSHSAITRSRLEQALEENLA